VLAFPLKLPGRYRSLTVLALSRPFQVFRAIVSFVVVFVVYYLIVVIPRQLKSRCYDLVYGLSDAVSSTRESHLHHYVSRG
jgi:hypothetical protein